MEVIEPLQVLQPLENDMTRKQAMNRIYRDMAPFAVVWLIALALSVAGWWPIPWWVVTLIPVAIAVAFAMMLTVLLVLVLVADIPDTEKKRGNS